MPASAGACKSLIGLLDAWMIFKEQEHRIVVPLLIANAYLNPRSAYAMIPKLRCSCANESGSSLIGEGKFLRPVHNLHPKQRLTRFDATRIGYFQRLKTVDESDTQVCQVTKSIATESNYIVRVAFAP